MLIPFRSRRVGFSSTCSKWSLLASTLVLAAMALAMPASAAASSGGPTLTGPGNPYPAVPGQATPIYSVQFTTAVADQQVTFTGSPVLEFSQNNPEVHKAPQLQLTVDGAVVGSSQVFPDDCDTDQGNQYSWSLGSPGFTGADFVGNCGPANYVNENDPAVTITVATPGPHTAVVQVYDGSDGISSYGGDSFYVAQGSLTATPAALPTRTDQCKAGGWQQYGLFKNQGDCVSFVATGGKNQPG